MRVFIDVWHRIWPLTPEAHDRFLAYYAEFVVAPPSDFFEVLAGFRYLDGASNSDFALYAFESMGAIQESMLSFGAGDAYKRATESLFGEIEIDEMRAIGILSSHANDARLDRAIERSQEAPARYARVTRKLPVIERAEACELLAQSAWLRRAGLPRRWTRSRARRGRRCRREGRGRRGRSLRRGLLASGLLGRGAAWYARAPELQDVIELGLLDRYD